ncbi:MAG: hypothetical protein OFPI_04960 [Osedax symbiont Rs2]|nr:MAG: hypothetical protein OFPI_04960 [Osedax symbiont Rs2]
MLIDSTNRSGLISTIDQVRYWIAKNTSLDVSRGTRSADKVLLAFTNGGITYSQCGYSPIVTVMLSSTIDFELNCL